MPVPEDSDRDWSRLEPGVVARIVHEVRRLGRWHCDGPTLRRLNRHWASQLNDSIVSVRPHWSRNLTQKDAETLLKFSKLTQLDLSPFLHFTTFEGAQGSNLTTLQRLKKVTSLILTRPITAAVVSTDGWRQLAAVTHLALLRGDSWRLSPDEIIHYGRNTSRPCRLWDIEAVCRLVKCLPSVREVEAEVSESAMTSDLAVLAKLESFKLSTRGSAEFTLSLLEISSLKELEVLDFPISSLESLELVQSLKRARLARCNEASALLTEAWSGILEKLTWLELSAGRQGVLLPDGVLRQGLSLKYLTLEKFKLKGQLILQQLNQLEALELRSCSMSDGLELMGLPNKLQRLAFLELLDCRLPWLKFPFDEASLPEIRSLELSSINGDPTLRQIVRYTTLEELQIGVSRPLSDACLRKLERLPNLRHLEFKLTRGSPLISQLLSLDFISSLESLSFVGRPVTKQEKTQLNEYGEWARERAGRQRIVFKVHRRGGESNDM